MVFAAFLSPVRLPLCSARLPSRLSPRRPPAVVKYSVSTPSMMGPMLPDFGSSKFFKSEIVQESVARLHEDHKMLGELGTRYKSFDREGKLKYIDSSLEMLDRWAILLQRFKLSEEFQCQMYVRQLETQLQSFGMTTDMLIQNTRHSLNMMRKEAEAE